jgi:hypothetical protein
VEILNPVDGTSLSGGDVVIAARVTDDNAPIAWVRFLIDGVQLGELTVTDHVDPDVYRMTWDTTGLPDGDVLVTVSASDGLNTGFAGVMVSVDNTSPVPFGVNSIMTPSGENWCDLAGGIVAIVTGSGFIDGGTTFQFNGIAAEEVPGSLVDSPTVDTVEVIVPRCPLSYPAGAASVVAGAGTASGTYGGLWWYYDREPMVMWLSHDESLTTPVQVNDGAVTLAVDARDDREVTGVTYQYDLTGTGAWVDFTMAPLTTWPYEFPLNADAFGAGFTGMVDFRALATDEAGQTGTSAVLRLEIVSALVNAPPVVTIDTPADGSVVYDNPLTIEFSIDDADADPAWTLPVGNITISIVDANRIGVVYASVATGEIATPVINNTGTGTWDVTADWDTTNLVEGDFYRIIVTVTDDGPATTDNVGYGAASFSFIAPTPSGGGDGCGEGGDCLSRGSASASTWILIAAIVMFGLRRRRAIAARS